MDRRVVDLPMSAMRVSLTRIAPSRMISRLVLTVMMVACVYNILNIYDEAFLGEMLIEIEIKEIRC